MTTQTAMPLGLRHIMPSVAAALGVPLREDADDQRAALGLPQANKALVWMVDGLGSDLLYDRAGHAPFLTRQLAPAIPLRSDFPSTTATSMTTFGTGSMPGVHGMMGYMVRDPKTHQFVNQVSWKDTDVDPRAWQPQPTVFEQCLADGVSVYQVGPAYFDGSGLTLAAFRGATFIAADSLAERISAATDLLRRGDRVLVYVYWGEVDRVGHATGCNSWAWSDELEAVDSGAALLQRLLPDDAIAIMTADHGMVDVPAADRIDVRDNPDLGLDVVAVTGEPRAPMLHCEPDTAAAVAQRWRSALATKAEVLLRDEAIARGWYGPSVADHAASRLGDVVLAMKGTSAIVDSRFAATTWDSMVGMHGAFTAAETNIPLLHLGATK